MNTQATLVKRCLDSYREANQPYARDRRSLGDMLVWEDSPSRLATFLKSRLLCASTINVSWLGLACAVLMARAHA